MHDSLTRTPLFDVYVRIKPLPPQLWPAHVVREDATVLVTIDPSSTRREIACWAPDNLSVQEMNAYRWAYGQPLVGRPLDDYWMSEECFPMEIPEPLRVPEFIADRTSRTA